MIFNTLPSASSICKVTRKTPGYLTRAQTPYGLLDAIAMATGVKPAK